MKHLQVCRRCLGAGEYFTEQDFSINKSKDDEVRRGKKNTAL